MLAVNDILRDKDQVFFKNSGMTAVGGSGQDASSNL
jgi:hypothetical protein